MLDFGDGDIELLDPIFDTSEDHALVFQRTGSRNVEFDSQQADHHLRHHADSLHDQHFNDIADVDVGELLKSDAALEARFDLAHIILEAAQRTYLALVDHDVVAKQAGLCVAAARDRKSRVRNAI